MQVKLLRKQNGWSQKTLADLSGVSTRTIQRIENGEPPGLDTAAALASIFEISIPELFPELGRTDDLLAKKKLKSTQPSLALEFMTQNWRSSLASVFFFGLLAGAIFHHFLINSSNTSVELGESAENELLEIQHALANLLNEQSQLLSNFDDLNSLIEEFQLASIDSGQSDDFQQSGSSESSRLNQFEDARELMWMVDCSSGIGDTNSERDCYQRAMNLNTGL